MNGLRLICCEYRASYHTNNCKSSLTWLVACFVLGKVYWKVILKRWLVSDLILKGDRNKNPQKEGFKWWPTLI